MPVVLSTRMPRERTTGGGSSAAPLAVVARDWWPQVHGWSQKTLRSLPRALVVAAPVIALFGIWLTHRLVSHRAQIADTASPTITDEQASPQPLVTTSPASSSSAPTESAPAPAQPGSASPESALLASAVPSSASVPVATPAELAQAVAHGLPAIEVLAAQFPGDPQVGMALATEQARAQRYEAAVATLDRVLTIAPSNAQSGKVMGILWRAAQSAASEQSFLSLRKLGGRGSDIAFDLATTPGVRPSVRDRAKTELANSLAPDASGDTRVAAALLLAADCNARKSLLERAEREGGKRTRALLEGIAQGAQCTSSTDATCNSCLAGTPALAHALAELSSGAKP